jgi:uncharacterized protein YfaS (alpha-2-macroglobulin family)
VSLDILAGDRFEMSGSSSAVANFSQPGDQVVNFFLKVKPLLGVGTVEVKARAGRNEAGDRIEIDIRNPNPPSVNVYESMIEAGKEWSAEFTYSGMAGTNKATLEVSAIPPIDINRRLGYLIQYPYGCVEQTTSAVFPQLYLNEITDLTDEMKSATESNIKSGIDKLRGFQNTDGGFKYWPDSPNSDEWSSSYAGHFLIEAGHKGFNVPESVLREWIRYQKRQANQWSKSQYRNSTLLQAYRLYTLSLAGEPQTGSMNRLREMELPAASKWRLAAAYMLAGMSDAAREMTANISMSSEPYKELSYTYGSSTRDEAMILEALVRMNRRNEGMDLMKKISTALSDQGRWMSTQETAFCLIAVSSFVTKEERSGSIRFEYSWNEGKKVTASTELPLVQKPLTIGNETKAGIALKNSGNGILYARIIQEGIPAVSVETESKNSLSLTVTYKDSRGEEVDLSRLRQGTEIVAEVSVANPGLRGDYQELALTQIFPSGFEIVNERLSGDVPDGSRQDNSFSYKNIRDDRIYTYFDLGAEKRKFFEVHLVAAYGGKFYMPGVYCEAMYDHSINARTKGQWIEITSDTME